MKLITKALEKVFAKYPLYSQENEGRNAKVLAKFFLPSTSCTWYVTEAERQGDDWLFFGYVEMFEGELGYFTLSQLQQARGRFGLRVERDMYFTPVKTTLQDIMN
ncbi:MAG: DUF2958 domain-containing protein [Muribaculaceae bacterium]